MLRPVSPPQADRELERRWFADEDFDLVVWLDPAAIPVAFELCYDRQGAERALTWSAERGYGHYRVDTGEDTPTRNLSPILVSDGDFPGERVVGAFTRAAGALDPAIRAFVLERLQGFGR
jgi:hypothetical protein